MATLQQRVIFEGLAVEDHTEYVKYLIGDPELLTSSLLPSIRPSYVLAQFTMRELRPGQRYRITFEPVD